MTAGVMAGWVWVDPMIADSDPLGSRRSTLGMLLLLAERAGLGSAFILHG